MQLLRGGALALRGGDGGGLDDLDAGVAHAVAAAHLLVHLLNSAVQGGVAVLLQAVQAGQAGQYVWLAGGVRDMHAAAATCLLPREAGVHTKPIRPGRAA